MRITGTHIYSLLHCSHAVALDLHEERSKRRSITEHEEFVRKRGRDWEDQFVSGLEGYQEPEFARGDFEDGANQTVNFLRDGVVGVTQGVLLAGDRLGIPDLLRRESGSSDFGDFHYVVGDIKSSGRPRSDQVLQVAFYSRMLGVLQGRSPDYGYLILKDGQEERFVLSDYAAAIEEVEERVFELAADPSESRPFFDRGCHKCHWSERCIPQMEEADDLSLVQGMTRGVRSTLQSRNFDTCGSLHSMLVDDESKATHLEPALLRRIKQGALARSSGKPIYQVRCQQEDLEDAAVIHHLYDAFAERLLFIGAQYPANSGGEVFGECPETKEDELAAFEKVVSQLPRAVPILHYSDALPRWYSDKFDGSVDLEARFVDLARRVRGVAVYQGPVFGVAQHAEYLLGVDPHREGHAEAAAIWASQEGGVDRLLSKGRADLSDLCGLVEAVLAEDLSGGLR